MAKARFESARRHTDRLSAIRARVEYLAVKNKQRPNGHVANELSALEWAIPILEEWIMDKHGEILPERMLFGMNKRAVVAELIERDGRDCYLCGDRIKTQRDMSVDHVLPLVRGGTNKMSNYALCHVQCNADKGNMTLETYRKWRRGEIQRRDNMDLQQRVRNVREKPSDDSQSAESIEQGVPHGDSVEQQVRRGRKSQAPADITGQI